MSKVFGIGLNKTGTRSLAAAMRLLGYRTLHKGDAETSALVERAEEERLLLLTYIGEKFDAYFDVSAIVDRFQTLDLQYPGSKFILTTRDVEGWLDSREKHVRANQGRAARGEYSGSWLTVDRDAWRAEFFAHYDAVSEYFARRPDDLLIVDIVGGDGWEVLAPFLGRRVPRQGFPWENQEGEGTYRKRRTSVLTRVEVMRLRAANVCRRIFHRATRIE